MFDGACKLPVPGYRQRIAHLSQAALSESQCAQFLAHLREAKRPLIYAGGGVVAAEAAGALREFAEASASRSRRR